KIEELAIVEQATHDDNVLLGAVLPMLQLLKRHNGDVRPILRRSFKVQDELERRCFLDSWTDYCTLLQQHKLWCLLRRPWCEPGIVAAVDLRQQQQSTSTLDVEHCVESHPQKPGIVATVDLRQPQQSTSTLDVEHCVESDPQKKQEPTVSTSG